LRTEKVMMMGHVICFRCGRSLDQEDELRRLTRACEECFNAVLSSSAGERSAYLESLEVPTVLVTEDQVVLDSNTLFLGMASTTEVVGTRIGEVLDCMYAPLLGQCGDTVPACCAR